MELDKKNTRLDGDYMEDGIQLDGTLFLAVNFTKYSQGVMDSHQKLTLTPARNPRM